MNQDKPRIGVYVCMCGSNIAGTVNVPAVVEAVSHMKNVVVSRYNRYTCSGPGQLDIQEDIKENKLNRVVVSACSPRMHERTWQAMLTNAGLNPYLLEVANLREQVSWTHPAGELTTQKAIDLVTAAVERVALHEPLFPKRVPVTKAAMVVGAGIAGIQASLDLAKAGIPVYLVERETSIGGHMAQLDKTFPTLDCSACILTPKMVDVESHPNITLLSNSEVEKVEGFMGNFQVAVRRKARFVKEDVCTACGDCTKVCPVRIPSEFESGIADRTAIYRSFAQAVPSAFAIDMRGIAPCKNSCPAGIHVQGYIALIAERRFKEAYDLIKQRMPFPGICGRVCHHPCEADCRRGDKDSPVAIEYLKRFVADWAVAHPEEIKKEGAEPSETQNLLQGKKVAIVGSGPVGLTVANDLAVQGAICDIFEALPVAGGRILKFPNRRLPKKIQEQEITDIVSMPNVNLFLNSSVQFNDEVEKSKLSFKSLRHEYDAVFLGTGAQKGNKITIPGIRQNHRGRIQVHPTTLLTDLPGVFSGGDVVTGAKPIVGVVGSGHRAAESIRRFLLGEDLALGRTIDPPDISNIDYYDPDSWSQNPRQEMPRRDKADLSDSDEIDLGFSEEQAVTEAQRCLSCSVCSECFACSDACKAGAIHYDSKDEIIDIDVGTIIVSTGYDVWDPSPMTEYGYGIHPEVYTGIEIERLSNSSGPTEGNIVMKNGEKPRRVAILHCVGSRDEHHQPYCSRICCMYSLKLAHLIREKTSAEVFEFYIDIRAFGKGYEEFYERVQHEGVVFVRGRGAQVLPDGNRLVVRAEDTDLARPVNLHVDMVILATGVAPSKGAEELAHTLHVTRDANGFFLEAHPKLRPVDSNTDGIFLAGACQAPRDIPDTVTHASAAASQALGLLSQEYVEVIPTIAEVNELDCVGCNLCVEVCPYGAPSLVMKRGKHVSEINEALCKGCGVCVAGCRGKAITLLGFNDTQLLTQLETLLQFSMS